MKKTIGTFAKVSFPEFGMSNVRAKVDTGAFTGALHTTKIHEEDEDGVPILYFRHLTIQKWSIRLIILKEELSKVQMAKQLKDILLKLI
jgi:hypothetical protein